MMTTVLYVKRYNERYNAGTACERKLNRSDDGPEYRQNRSALSFWRLLAFREWEHSPKKKC
jgi:hypothetical protein